MATKHYSDPWRYRCPDCDSCSIRANCMTDLPGPTATTRYHCRSCDWQGPRLYDVKRETLV